jgi:hypothetical protein
LVGSGVSVGVGVGPGAGSDKGGNSALVAGAMMLLVVAGSKG